MTIHVYSQDKEAAMKSDFISLHCPLTKDTAKMVNDAFIAQMKPGAVLINTARGGLIDEDALSRALKDGRVSGAALDVLATEPAAKDCSLIGLDNCIITPHMAWAPKEMRQAVIDVLVSNLESWLNHETVNRVDV